MGHTLSKEQPACISDLVTIVMVTLVLNAVYRSQ